MWIKGLLTNIAILLFIPYCYGATSIAPATTTTDPATTTGTIFTEAQTESSGSNKVQFTDPEVYGPVIGGTVLLLGGVIATVVILKKGLLSGKSAAAGGMSMNNGTAPQSTAIVERIQTAKVSRSKVRPLKMNVRQISGRKPSFSVIRVQRTTLSIHSITGSKV